MPLVGGITVPDIDPFSVCQRQGGRRPDLIRRQRGDIDSRCQERFRQMVQGRHGHNFRTGQLYDRRRFRQIRPDRQGQPHDRFRPAGTVYFRGNLHRCQRAGDSFPCGGTVHPAPERRSDDRRRGVCTRRHRIQERRGGDAQGALRPVARSLYRHDERHLRVGHQGFGGIRGHDTDSCRGSRSHDHNGRFGNEHGGGRQDNHRIGTVHHFGSQRLHEGRDADLRTECRSRIGSRRFRVPTTTPCWVPAGHALPRPILGA